MAGDAAKHDAAKEVTRTATAATAVLMVTLVRDHGLEYLLAATVLAGLPLILSEGAGSEARASIGWVVFGGLGLGGVYGPGRYRLERRW